MKTQRVSFANNDGQLLAGLLDLPAGPPRAYALFAHCFTCSKNVKAAANIARALNLAGIAVLRFDFTGLGESEGEFGDTNFSGNVADLVAAARFLESTYQAPALLVGHSLGGAAVLAAAAQIPSAVAIATIAAPSRPAHIRHLLGPVAGDLQERGEAEIQLGGRPFTIKQQFITDLEEHSSPEDIARLRKALLIMHAPLDDIVDIGNASELFMMARHPKSFLSLDTADHLLSRAEDAHYAGTALAGWASHYLPVSLPQDAPTGAPGETVAVTDIGGFFTEMSVAGHAMIADEPVSLGGTDMGPSPYDLLSAALASCTTMTLRMYAEHKGLDLSSITASVSHGKVHEKDCEDCENASAKVDEFRRTLSFEGNVSDAQRERLLQIADRCPVHRTLHAEVKVRTVLAD